MDLSSPTPVPAPTPQRQQKQLRRGLALFLLPVLSPVLPGTEGTEL